MANLESGEDFLSCPFGKLHDCGVGPQRAAITVRLWLAHAADSRPFRVVAFGLDRDWPHLKRLRDVYLVCRGLASHFIKTPSHPEREPNPNGDFLS